MDAKGADWGDLHGSFHALATNALTSMISDGLSFETEALNRSGMRSLTGSNLG